jgi:hypothetical protein
MGNFLSFSSVIGKPKDDVARSLEHYAKSVRGGLMLESDNENACVIAKENGNTTILYPDGYVEWDESSEFITKELNAAVFSFHIHDGDFWMYLLFYKGEVADQFNPIPDYWDDELSDEEIDSWKGSAETITKLIPSININDIENYLVRWDLENDDIQKAYSTDEYEQEDWQLIDFMRKLALPYPLDDSGNPKGPVYKLWTKQFKR